MFIKDIFIKKIFVGILLVFLSSSLCAMDPLPGGVGGDTAGMCALKAGAGFGGLVLCSAVAYFAFKKAAEYEEHAALEESKKEEGSDYDKWAGVKAKVLEGIGCSFAIVSVISGIYCGYEAVNTAQVWWNGGVPPEKETEKPEDPQPQPQPQSYQGGGDESDNEEEGEEEEGEEEEGEEEEGEEEEGEEEEGEEEEGEEEEGEEEEENLFIEQPVGEGNKMVGLKEDLSCWMLDQQKGDLVGAFARSGEVAFLDNLNNEITNCVVVNNLTDTQKNELREMALDTIGNFDEGFVTGDPLKFKQNKEYLVFALADQIKEDKAVAFEHRREVSLDCKVMKIKEQKKEIKKYLDKTLPVDREVIEFITNFENADISPKNLIPANKVSQLFDADYLGVMGEPDAASVARALGLPDDVPKYLKRGDRLLKMLKTELTPKPLGCNGKSEIVFKPGQSFLGKEADMRKLQQEVELEKYLKETLEVDKAIANFVISPDEDSISQGLYYVADGMRELFSEESSGNPSVADINKAYGNLSSVLNDERARRLRDMISFSKITSKALDHNVDLTKLIPLQGK